MKKKANPTPPETPLQQQWRYLKTQVPDHLVACRLGDFYEFFECDAASVARVLEIAVTKRNGVSMAGVPVHSWERYADQLAFAGYDVAVADYPDKGDKREIVSFRQCPRSRIKQARRVQQQAADDYYALIASIFPPGSKVRYKGGKVAFVGTVKEPRWGAVHFTNDATGATHRKDGDDIYLERLP